MQTEINNNIHLEENAAPPIPPTPHFNEEGIAAAKPVELLPAKRSNGVRWSRLWRRHLGLLAIVAFGLLFASSIAVAVIEAHLQPQAAPETNVAAEKQSAGADSSEPAIDSSDKKVAELADKKQTESVRPAAADNDNDQSRKETRNDDERTFVRTSHPVHVKDRVRFSIERGDIPFMVMERPSDGGRRARLVTVIH